MVCLAMPLSACAGTPDVIYYPEPPLVVRDGENDSLIFSLDFSGNSVPV